MNRPQSPDAFSKTLESKPRQSYIHHAQHLQQQQQQQQQNEQDFTNSGSTVNRLSRVFENTPLEKPKPIPPSKPTTLRPNSYIKPKIEPQEEQQETIDSSPLAFKDIRARFQQENAIPIKQQVNIPKKPEIVSEV